MRSVTVTAFLSLIVLYAIGVIALVAYDANARFKPEYAMQIVIGISAAAGLVLGDSAKLSIRNIVKVPGVLYVRAWILFFASAMYYAFVFYNREWQYTRCDMQLACTCAGASMLIIDLYRFQQHETTKMNN